MLTASVTVWAILLILWWGIYGFICCSALVIEGFAAIHLLFGRRGLCVALILTGLLLIKIGNDYEHKEQRVVEAFMTSWQSDSDNNGERYVGMDKWEYLIDWGRSEEEDVPSEGDFTIRKRLVSYSEVVKIYSTKMDLREDTGNYIKAGRIGVKVFKVNIRLREQESLDVYDGLLTFYVARDNKKIIKMRLE